MRALKKRRKKRPNIITPLEIFIPVSVPMVTVTRDNLDFRVIEELAKSVI